MPLYVPKSINVNLREDQVKNIFKEHDANGDGRLSREELMKAFKQLGSRLPVWRVSRGISKADKDGDGFVSVEELHSLVKYAVECGYIVN